MTAQEGMIADLGVATQQGAETRSPSEATITSKSRLIMPVPSG